MNITGAQALELLDQVVGGRETVIYDTLYGCLYERHGRPSCGVGRALALAGVPIDTLAEMDAMESSSINYSGTADVLRGAGVTLDTRAVEVFHVFQKMQDARYPWGTAYTHASDTLNLLITFNLLMEPQLHDSL